MNWIDLAQYSGMCRALVNVKINLQFHKMRGTSWLEDNLLASQEGLCSMELAGISYDKIRRSENWTHPHKNLRFLHQCWQRFKIYGMLSPCRLTVTDFSNDGFPQPEEGGSKFLRNYLPEKTILHHGSLGIWLPFYVGLTIKEMILRWISQV